MLTDPEVAVIVAVPLATEVTVPVSDTVAIATSDEDHVTVGFEITLSPASLTVAVSCVVSPRALNVSDVSDSFTVAGTWRTVTSAVPLADAEVAVIVAVPLMTAVTRPADDTVATAVCHSAGRDLHLRFYGVWLTDFPIFSWNLDVRDIARYVYMPV